MVDFLNDSTLILQIYHYLTIKINDSFISVDDVRRSLYVRPCDVSSGRVGRLNLLGFNLDSFLNIYLLLIPQHNSLI